MALQDLKITVLINNVPSQRLTSQLEPIFKAFALGTDSENIPFAKVAADILQIGGKLKITGGTEVDHAVVKQQLDDVNTAITGRIDTLESTLTGDISDLDGRMDTLETNMTTLQGDVGDLTTLVGSYEGRISTLETDVAAIYANTPKEQRFTATEGQTLFTVTTFSFDAGNTVQDIELWIDGRRQALSTMGDFSDGAWRKNSTTIIEAAEGVPAGKEVIVWKQGTSSGSGGGGGSTGIAVKDEGTTVESNAIVMDFAGAGVTVTRPTPGQVLVTIPSGGGGTDLENIAVDITPNSAGAHSVGTLLKPWKSLILKDTDNADVWEIKVSSGVLMAVKLN